MVGKLTRERIVKIIYMLWQYFILKYEEDVNICAVDHGGDKRREDFGMKTYFIVESLT